MEGRCFTEAAKAFKIGAMISPAPRQDIPYAAGDLLAGRYRLGGLLGEGGFSTVFAAEDAHLGRKVAVKVLSRKARDGEEARTRFEREAQLVSKLSCPHTVRLFDFGQTEAGDPFLVLELIDGETLQDRIARGPLPPAEIVDIVRQVLESLREAHDAGIIHRDLKPSNIMLYEEYGAIGAKVLDFGVAGILGAAPNQPAPLGTLTGHGAVLGTRGYMSPEQALGQKLTVAADVFALGVVAVEAMTGHNPLRQQAQSPLKLAMLRERMRVPEEVELSESVREVFDRMLAADVSKRFPDGGQTLAALERALVGARSAQLPADEADEPAVGAPRSSKAYLPAFVGAAILLGAVAAVVFSFAGTHFADNGPPVPPSQREPERSEGGGSRSAASPPSRPSQIPEESARLAHTNIAIAVEVARLRAIDRAANREPKVRAAKRPKPQRRTTKAAKPDPVPTFKVELVGEESK